MILGLNAYTYCSGIALYDGNIELCIEEERLSREKKTKAFPRRSLAEAAPGGFEPGEVDTIAYPWSPERLGWETAKLIGRGFPSSLRLLHPASDPNGNPALPLQGRFQTPRDASRHFRGSRPPVAFVPHHLAHASLAFFGSPFDDAIVIVSDAFGDACSISVWLGQGNRLTPLMRNRFVDSLGCLYSLVTDHLGYATAHDEGKVMALAALGGDRYYEELAELVTPTPEGGLQFDYSFFNWPKAGELKPFTRRFIDRFGPRRQPHEPLEQRHHDLAAALQHTLERSLLHIARSFGERHDTQNLALAGGTMLNCVANGRLARETPFSRVFIPPNPDDGGAALGAAMWVQHGKRLKPRSLVLDTSSYGLGCEEGDVDRALRGRHAIRLEQPAGTAAALLAAGHTLGWCQGRMEMGPRALGHRSLLADPRRAEIKDHLNARVKHREPYRPFAPSILEERLADWFPDSPPSPFMSFSSHVAKGREAEVPAVLHVDGSARLQTVSATHAPEYHALISAFERLTGVPMVLNTSLNDREPICCTPADAVRCFDGTEIDALIVNDRLLLSERAKSQVDDSLIGRTALT